MGWNELSDPDMRTSNFPVTYTVKGSIGEPKSSWIKSKTVLICVPNKLEVLRDWNDMRVTN